MSEHAHDNIPAVEKFDSSKLGGLPKMLLIAGAAGLGVTAIGAAINVTQFAYTYLFAFAVFFTLITGMMFWLCLHHATDSEWSVVIRRQMENVACLLPYMFIFFVPALLCAKILWAWWDVAPGVDPLLDAKQAYLNHNFFLLRLVFYFGI